MLFAFVLLFPSSVSGTVLLWYNFQLKCSLLREIMLPLVWVSFHFGHFAENLDSNTGNFSDGRVYLDVTKEQIHGSILFIFVKQTLGPLLRQVKKIF